VSDYYISTDGDNGNPGTEGSPFATFAYSFTQMATGDTLIVKDGTYTEAIRNPLSGSAPQNTIIRAENNFGVLVECLSLGSYRYALDINSKSYVQVEGIKFKTDPDRLDTDKGGTPAHITYSDHLKILRSAFYDCPNTDNRSAVRVADSSYVLFEECWAWGHGRYKFTVYESDKVIMRRCVARHDSHDSYATNPHANFTSYKSDDTVIQNCIAIDSDQDEYYLSGVYYGGFYIPINLSEDNKIMGCIGLKLAGLAGINNGGADGDQEVKDTVIWDSKGGINYQYLSGPAPTLSVDHVTCGNIWGTASDAGTVWGTGARTRNFAGGLITNSLLYDCHSFGVADDINSDYNDFFSNGKDHGGRFSEASPGANDLFLAPAMKYIVRIEDGSPLKGAADDGGDIGATIFYQYGVAGTLWGEEGYEDLTDDSLWPFPNEDEIKSDMSSFVGPPSGERGFCVDEIGLYGGSVTLTSYIWEYLGYAIPSDIYGVVTLAVVTTTLSNGTVDSPYSEELTATGGVSPYTWSVSAGSLPNGLSLSAGGTISGTSTTLGTSTFTVQVEDSLSNTDTQELVIVVDVVAARSGLAWIITYVREMVNDIDSDVWTDGQIREHIDPHRTYVRRKCLDKDPDGKIYSAGTEMLEGTYAYSTESGSSWDGDATIFRYGTGNQVAPQQSLLIIGI